MSGQISNDHGSTRRPCVPFLEQILTRSGAVCVARRDGADSGVPQRPGPLDARPRGSVQKLASRLASKEISSPCDMCRLTADCKGPDLVWPSSARPARDASSRLSWQKSGPETLVLVEMRHTSAPPGCGSVLPQLHTWKVHGVVELVVHLPSGVTYRTWRTYVSESSQS